MGCLIIIWDNILEILNCRDRNGYFTSGFPQKTGTSQMRCLNEQYMTEIIIELDYSDGVMHLADFRWRSLDVRL